MGHKGFEERLAQAFEQQSPKPVRLKEQKTKGKQKIFEPRLTINESYNKNRSAYIIGAAACASVAAAVAVGFMPSIDTAPNRPENTDSTSTQDPAQDNSPEIVQQVRNFDFNPAINFGTEGDCHVRVYSVENQTLAARPGNILRDVHISAAQVALKTCVGDAEKSVTDGKVDKTTNTVKEIVEIDGTTFAISAELLNTDISISTVSPGEELLRLNMFKSGCGSLPVWGCPKGPTLPPPTASLSNEVKQELLLTSQAFILSRVQAACGRIDNLEVRRLINESIDRQAESLGLSPSLVIKKYVDTSGSILDTVPNYMANQTEILDNQGARITANKIKDLYIKPKLKANCVPQKVGA